MTTKLKQGILTSWGLAESRATDRFLFGALYMLLFFVFLTRYLCNAVVDDWRVTDSYIVSDRVY